MGHMKCHIGVDACIEINHSKNPLCLKMVWPYTNLGFQMLFLAKFLAATPMLYLKICRSLSDISSWSHGSYIVILVLANFHAVTTIIFF